MKRMVLLLSVLLLVHHADANELENWYTYWGLGYANVGYPGELDDSLDAFGELPGVDHMSISLDMLGFYRPSGEKVLNGIIVNGFGDRYDVEEASMQINGYLVSGGTMIYAQKIGEGAFLRVDGGLARYVLSVSSGGASETESSDWGVGGLVGGGFAVPIAGGSAYCSTRTTRSVVLKGRTPPRSEYLLVVSSEAIGSAVGPAVFWFTAKSKGALVHGSRFGS